MTDVSIVIPCLNEIEGLPLSLDRAEAARRLLKEKGLSAEIIVSDNGSADGSRDFAASRGARVVECPRRGYGHALIYGIRAASGKYIVMGDSDGAHDFREAVLMIEKLREGFDVCMGSRLRGKIMPGAMRWKNRYIGNPVLTGLLNLFFHSGFSDAHCGLRAFTKTAFERMQLISGGMEFASEMAVKATLLKLKRTEIPITMYPEVRSRAPHLRPWKDGWRHLKFLLMYGPLWIFFIPAVSLMAAGALIFGMVYTAPPYGTVSFAGLEFGDHWMIFSSGLFTIGFQSLLLGFIALLFRLAAEPAVQPVIPVSPLMRGIAKGVTLENAVLLSIFWMFAAIPVSGSIIWQAINRQGPVLFQLREMMLVTTCMVLSAQTFFSGLLLSIMELDRTQQIKFREA